MRVGLYFGSFNPIHTGHLIIANHVLEFAEVDRVWFIVSPQNPLKESRALLNEHHRLHLVNLAIEDNSHFKCSNVEFSLPRPSYTIDTLTYLTEKYPKYEFSVIMGADSFSNIQKWKNYQQILHKHKLIIYKRPGFEIQTISGANINVVDAPLLEISATYIRDQIQQKKSIKYLVPPSVEEYILANHYYAK